MEVVETGKINKNYTWRKVNYIDCLYFWKTLKNPPHGSGVFIHFFFLRVVLFLSLFSLSLSLRRALFSLALSFSLSSDSISSFLSIYLIHLIAILSIFITDI